VRRDANDNRNGERLLLSAKEAASLLGMNRKTLWDHTAPRGACIPSVRVGRFLRYSRTSLERWISEREGATREEATD
jgi:predicted DNA-binding transcriptional regulator AlpA